MINLAQYQNITKMKKSILTFALMTAFGAFLLTSNAAPNTNSVSTEFCEGEHECDDKCKKNKKGKCTEAKAQNQGENAEKGKASCCKKSEKSCKSKKSKSTSKEVEETAPKSE